MASRLRSERGFTLTEVMVAASLLLVGMLGAVALIDGANSATVKNKGREAATSLSREIIDASRSLPYSSLTPERIEAALQSVGGLESKPGSPIYTIERRGFTYSVDLGVCALDDPRDGIGAHTQGTFCNDAGNDCAGALAAAGGADVDVNGNALVTLETCVTVDGTLVFDVCDLLDSTVAAQQTASLGDLLGPLNSDAVAAASATACVSGSAVAADNTPEDYKRVTVDLRWENRRIQQATLIPNPGVTAGPAIATLESTTHGGGDAIAVTSGTAVGFAATTDPAADSVSWLLDGDVRGDAALSGSTWLFSWDLGTAGASGSVQDGTYVVGARGFDNYGGPGLDRSVTVNLNRSAPAAPQGVVAGKSGNDYVDIEWRPNTERDILHYKVFRTAEGNVPICTTTQTACRDTSPPSASRITYRVVAYDTDPGTGAERAGPNSDPATTAAFNTRPNAPASFQGSVFAGDVVLNWDAATDPDLLDTIAFYRIYRDGAGFDARYDRTYDGSQLSYADTAVGGVSHTYYVTAVDNHFSESLAAGPITLP